MLHRTLVLVGILAVGVSSLAGDGRKGRTLVDQSYLCGRTLLELRSAGTALSAYLLDHPSLPEGVTTLEAVRPLIEPVYIREVELEDAWGTGFRLVVGPDRKSFRLVSAGSDGEFAEDS